MLKEKGVIFIIRYDDVDIDLLSEDVREDFLENIEDAKEPVSDMNELEDSYNSYMVQIYHVLSETDTTNDIQADEEEYYE